MPMIWDSFIKKEELELSPGVLDGELIRALSLNTYLEYISGMIEMGENLFPAEVSDQLEEVMTESYMCFTHIMEGRYPEPDEISAYLKQPGNTELIRSLTDLCVNANVNTWPEELRKIRDRLPMDKIAKINWDSEERKQNAAKMRKRFEKSGCIEL